MTEKKGITFGESVEIWKNDVQEYSRWISDDSLYEVADYRKKILQEVMGAFWQVEWAQMDLEGLVSVVGWVDPLHVRLLVWKWICAAHAAALDNDWFYKVDEIELIPPEWIPEGMDWQEPEDIPDDIELLQLLCAQPSDKHN